MALRDKEDSTDIRKDPAAATTVALGDSKQGFRCVMSDIDVVETGPCRFIGIDDVLKTGLHRTVRCGQWYGDFCVFVPLSFAQLNARAMQSLSAKR